MAASASSVDDDPRAGLTPGLFDAETVSDGLELLSTQPKPAGVDGTNSDLAFSGDYAYSGNYNGVNIYDVSDPAAPVLDTSVLCPGNQNDISVYGDLLILSVEATSGRIDCKTTTELPGGAANPQNVFRGIRIFDISDRTNPVNIAEVQTCKGSHTHTIVGEKDGDLYIYGSGTAGIRSAAELARCSAASSLADPNTANFAIDIIKVPLDDPASASRCRWTIRPRPSGSTTPASSPPAARAPARTSTPPARSTASRSPTPSPASRRASRPPVVSPRRRSSPATT
ncbi:hypothetical protein [Aquipuribacter sp. MA13-6]|uniref:hypothetical protein n=1 Tax=Aquipuribacter sp. MA13-6 TaxID=3440839 RepID=UPI003EEE5B92